MGSNAGQPSPIPAAPLEFLQMCNIARNEAFNDLMAIQPKIRLNAQRNNDFKLI